MTVFIIFFSIIVMRCSIAVSNHNLPFVLCECNNRFDNIGSLESYSKNISKLKIEKLFENPSYSYKEADLLGDCLGTTLLFAKEITIDYEVDEFNYVFVLTHELVHLVYFTCSERFANYQTFITLYESNDPTFLKIAKIYANMELSGDTGQPEVYKCGWYIQAYLNW